MQLYRRFIKPLGDRIFALAMLLLTAPLIFILAIALMAQNRGSPFFLQPRVGKDEKIFSVIKFKTMSDRRHPDGTLFSDKDRMTRLGRIVRKLSLDELPQLYNILLGQMSFVGPRPLLVEYLPHYSARHRRRHEVLPGITGLAQVIGRNTMLFSRRFDADVEYVDNLSFSLDVSILARTLGSALRGKNITMGADLKALDDVGITRDLPAHYFSKPNAKSAGSDADQ
jgi:lipopolysaccharide/colanic/teichoic acid biosynthesis glycosyltransferase